MFDHVRKEYDVAHKNIYNINEIDFAISLVQ